MGIVFVASALLVAGLRLLLLWTTVNFSSAVGTDLSVEVFRRTLYQPYRIHVSRNSSEIISSLTGKIGLAIGTCASSLAIITGGV